jgi:hypothetical protein
METGDGKSSNPVAPELYQKLLDLAVEIIEDNGFSADFTNESIQSIEKILGDMHDHYVKTKDEEGLRGIAVEFATYIIETIRRNSGVQGEFYSDHADFGDHTYPFLWKGNTIFPYAWCMKRMFDGKGDDVWFKYKTLIIEKLD